MRVQILSPYPASIARTLELSGDKEVKTDPDWIVCYGHRERICEPMLSRYAGRIVNLHISLLPWNRGAEPNLWSWIEHTPKGVSIHLIDAGLDTGPIMAQREVQFDPSDTLASSYARLRMEVERLFADTWPQIRRSGITPKVQPACGSMHKRTESESIWPLLPLGYETLCGDVAELGSELSMTAGAFDKIRDEIGHGRSGL
jgi:methionyl-tRNA formyltransferase